MERKISASKTNIKLAVVAVAVMAAIGFAAPLAIADSVGAPTSAAGGVSAPSSPSRPGSAGPLSGTSGSLGTRSMGGSFDDHDSSRIRNLQPGTGKFEGPHNGTSTPCIGSTGFGSSGGVPGRAC